MYDGIDHLPKQVTRCVGYICIQTDLDDDEDVCIQTDLDDGEVDKTDTIELSCYILPYNLSTSGKVGRQLQGVIYVYSQGSSRSKLK